MRRLFIAGLLVLTLAACGGGGDRVGQDGAEFNQQDADFASEMIPHHEQALQMASLARERAANAEVKELAQKIEQAQAAEIDTMSAWLNDWGKRGATMPPHGIAHEAHGPGMATEEQLAELESAKGAAFDRLFLQLMIAHHRGAIEMADEQLAEGRHEGAKKLAEQIKSAQQREIAEMGALQQKL